MKKPDVTQADIAAGLRRMGLRAGDRVMVHSSLSSLGNVEEGAYAVIDAFLEVLGPDGTLMFPTFNHGLVEVFDVRETRSYNGRITETFRHMPGVLRSNHPTHAYAALGKDAARYVKDSNLHLAWGPESPLGRLITDGGWVVLLGVDHGSSTAQHHGETQERVKCFGLDTSAVYMTDDEGQVIPSVAPTWRGGVCPYSWRRHEGRLRFLRAVRDGYIGASHVQMMRGSATVKAVAQLLRGETGVDHCAKCPFEPDLGLYENTRNEKGFFRQPSRWSPRGTQANSSRRNS